VRVVVLLKKRVARLNQAHIELKMDSTDLGGHFQDVFSAELGFFGEA
jgi:hypothetical protein